MKSWPRSFKPGWRPAWRYLALALYLASVLAISGGVAGREGGPGELSLAEAIDLGLENNPAIEIATLELEQAMVAREQADDAAGQLDEDFIAGLDLRRVKDLYPRQTEMGEKIARKGLEVTRDGIRVAIQQAYFSAAMAGQLLAARQEAVTLAERQLGQARAGYRTGTRAKTDVLAAETHLAAARADLSTARTGLATALMDLNRAAGLPLTAALTLTSKLEETAPAPVDIEEAVSAALAHSAGVLAAAEQAAVAARDRELAGRYYTPNTYVYRQADLEAKKAATRLAAARVDGELAVRKAHLEMLDAYERIGQHRTALALSEEANRLADLRYRAGVATSSEVLDAQVRLSGARVSLTGAVFAYNMARLRFENLTGLSGGTLLPTGGTLLPTGGTLP